MALTKASLVDLNANELILDLDADTSIRANTDDTVDIKIAGNVEVKMTATALAPGASDGNALGTAALEWSDLFLADGAVINFGDDQDVSLTHVADSGLLLSSTDKLMFNDASQFIQGASATVLDIAATDEIELTATLIDVVGNLAVSGTIIGAGALTAATSITVGSAVLTEAELETLDGITVGTAIASKVVTTDANIDTTGQRNLTISGELDAATGDFSGDVDIDGTANLDVVDIDGATQIDAIVTVGVDDTGYDVKFFGATSGSHLLWDESADDLILAGAAGLILPDGKLTLGSTAVTSTAAELNLLDGVSGLVQADLTKLAAIDATATELNLIDGGATVGTTAIADGDGLLINDAGTMRVSTVQTLAAYLDDEITAMPNLITTAATTVGALDSGSITSGFTSIDVGAGAITTTGTGTIGNLVVDDVAVNGKVITMTGSSGDTAVMTVAANGALSIVTVDAAGAAANIAITADGTMALDAEGALSIDSDSTIVIDSAGVLTLDSGAAINLEPAAGSAILLDGTISIDAGVVTGATSITSTAFVGALTGAASSNLLKAGGTMTGNTLHGDNIASHYGASNDLKIYHDGTHSYIDDSGTGDLRVRGTGLSLRSFDTNEPYLNAAENGAVTLYYDNAAKLATSSAGGTLTGDLTVTDDIILNSDSAAITFGADADVTLTHVADKGLTIKTTGTGDGVFPILNLSAGQTDMQGSDPLGRIDFQAPDEGTGTDAILVAGRIQVVSEGDFSASNNATSMQLAVGASGTAGTVMTLTSTGRVVSQATAKTWIDFNGQSTVAIRDSHNVSGLGDEGTGYYTVSHDVDLATVNAAAVSSASGSANTYNDGVSTAHQAVGSFTVMGWHGTNGTATDHERFYVVVFGD